MKQITLQAQGGLDALKFEDVADASDPGPGEVRIRLYASSLNFHDYLVVSTPGFVKSPRIPMADGAGVIDAVGEGVTEFAPGDNVVSHFFPGWIDGADGPSSFQTTPGDGVDGYAREYVTVPAYWVTRAPRGWSHAEAATITTAGVTAWRALVVNGGLKAGDWVAVLGTGGVSIYALQLAKAMGARVVATSSSDEKLERVREMGADAVVNYRKIPEWGAEIRRLTEGRGADHVIEVGGAATLAQSITAARDNGHIALIGVLTGLGGEIPTAQLMAQQQRLQGLIVGSRRHQQDFVAALEATRIRPLIDRQFPLQDIRAAFEFQASGGHFGKIGLSIGS
ncbi:NADPH:quinone reductase [Paracoccus halophilus]|uniref:NADPH:quinone oxidoreductase n=1 Tax=Paracoccus halophilus TaxID=376733 RepID=A0A099F4E8_9RHOB|nr:NAD(P)-dependent alcohol dehydrogenase [Paracoccus halophilus]KGJ05600.1 NADPH:quinone oxidoreductase [Paracoccus halophilus]SFA47318.1 NADPH:quinone reductase [Paracoccus halophilus]